VWGVAATGVLVETLLDRGAESDVAEAEAAIERLAATSADDGSGHPRHLAAAAAVGRLTSHSEVNDALSRAPLRPAPVRRHLTP